MKLLLFLLVVFIALTAIVSGSLMINDPDGSTLDLSVNLLSSTPFKNFLVPGIILTGLVGGMNLLAVFYNLQRNKNRYNWAMAGGFLLCGWILLQMFLINVTHWLHFIYMGTGILVILIAYQINGKWAV